MADARTTGRSDPSWSGHDDQSRIDRMECQRLVHHNYDILRDYPEISSGKSWDLLILDESHKLKNPEAIRTQHVFGSGTIAPIPSEKALLLTGTPMINYVHDLYTQFHCLDPAMWPSFEQFVADHYFPGYKIISPSQIVGVERNLERLRRQLQAIMIRRPKSILDLPPKTREIVEVDIADNEGALARPSCLRITTMLSRG